jgi:transcriptional regulator with XRE-family HTH domain
MEKDVYELLGEKVRELRKKAKLSQMDLAKKAGVSQSELSKFENRGEDIRSIGRVNALLTVLGYQLDISEKKLR